MLTLFETVYRPTWRKAAFKFEEAWTSDTRCGNIITEARSWEASQGNQHLDVCLKKCAAALEEWGRNFNKEFKNQISYLRSSFARVYSKPPPWYFKLIHKWERELDVLLETEEIYWKQRSREN